MKKITYILFLFAIILYKGSLAQTNVQIAPLNKLLDDYHINSSLGCNLPGDDIQGKEARKSGFRELFLDESVPIYYELDTSTYRKYSITDYIKHFTEFFEPQNMDFDSIFIYNVTIEKVRSNGIVVIEFVKSIKYIDNTKYIPKEISLDYYIEMTLAFDVNRSKYMIIHIDESEYIAPDGLGSSKFVPDFISFKLGPTVNFISNPDLEYNNSINWFTSASLHYLLGGKNNFNYFLSAGVDFSRSKINVFKNSFELDIPDQVDIDGDSYMLNLDNNYLEQTYKIAHIGIPVDLEFRWLFKSFSVTPGLGIKFSYPLSNSVSLDKADVFYSGQYVFENQNVLFDYLPEYGFMHFDENNFTDVQTLDLNPTLHAHLNLLFNFPINNKWNIGFGPELYFGLNDLVKSHEINNLISNDVFYSPNLLSFGNKTTANSLGLSFNMSYNVQRPNVPYIPNIKASELPENNMPRKLSPCTPTSEESIRSQNYKMAIYIEEDYNLPSQVKKFRYEYCGFNKTNSEEGKLKTGKLNVLDIKIPEDQRKQSGSYLYIKKPYMVDLYSDSLETNPDEEYVRIFPGQIKKFNPNNPVTMYAKELPVLDIFYIDDDRQQDETFKIDSFTDSILTWINKYSLDDVHQVALYFPRDTTTSRHDLIYSDNQDKILNRLSEQISSLRGEYLGIDKEKFKEFLDAYPCKRRDVNLNFVIASPKRLNDLPELIESIFEYKFKYNSQNLTITIYVPWDSEYETITKADIYVLAYSIFVENKLRKDFFNYRIIKFKF